MIITIDGPTASGKSTVARLLASKLGYYYIASGFLFRGLAYLLIHNKGYTLDTIASPSSQDVEYILDEQRFIYRYTSENAEQVFFENREISQFLKDSIIDTASSLVSTNVLVRELLCDFQRKLAQKYNVVVDGRDTGSLVFPYAEYKFFLTADIGVRASRWQLLQKKRGFNVTLEEAIKIISERDKRDAERTVGPLVVPQGALVIDNSEMDVQQTADEMIKVIQKPVM